MTHNEKTVTLELKRIDICDLMIACTSAAHRTDAKKWRELHRRLKAILDSFDEENFTDEEM